MNRYARKLFGVMFQSKQGIYPFRGMKLSRADVEWLLATHENGRGPVNWSDEGQRGRKGLDLRGADLCQVDLMTSVLTSKRTTKGQNASKICHLTDRLALKNYG